MPANSSLAELLSSLPPNLRAEALADIPESQCAAFMHDWRGFWARPNQILPGTPGAAIQRSDWLFWVLKAGRGFGKTRVGAETVREWARDPKARILMIAPTTADVREVMIEGESGLLQCYPGDSRPVYNSSRHLVTFPSGAIGITRSADEPERLRGPQFNKFWADELCAWNYAPEAWDQLSFGFRVRTDKLQGVITTTPKPIKVFKKLLANPSTVVTGGSSYENRANLADEYFARVIAPYEGTRLGRQEILAEVLDDVPGALWTQAAIDRDRCMLSDVPDLVRVVVPIDPAVTANENSDETGMGCIGLAQNGHLFVLDDRSRRATPGEWGVEALMLMNQWKADRLVGEVNNGGDLVEANVRACYAALLHQRGIYNVSPVVPFNAVRAKRGKYTRAEPVAALYEQRRVHHVASEREHAYPRALTGDPIFSGLEDQQCSFVPGMEGDSPDRLDWLVWGAYDLLIQPAETYLVQTGIAPRISPI